MNNREKLEQAAKYIAQAFDWDESEEGYEYWEEVYDNLKVLEKEADE